MDRQADAWVAGLPDPTNTWIFATGSLLWDPDFVFTDRRRAKVEGWHRALCLLSLRYRGTPEKPGLVMGLAPGGACEGCAFRLCPDNLQASARQLWRREMGHGSYEMLSLTAETADGPVPCYGFTPRPDHPQCAFDLDDETVEDTVRCAAGLRGPNVDYVLNTAEQLDALGIHDPRLHALAARLRGS